MIVDSFIFFNEEDILEIRLNELYDKVDKFVLIEADRKFNNEKKPLYYLENRDGKYAKFKDKIINVSIQKEDFDLQDPKYNESFLRNAVTQAIKNSGFPDDCIILLSDVDEIPILDKWNLGILNSLNNNEALVFRMSMYYYYFNCIQNYNWPGTVATRKSMFTSFSGQRIRDLREHPQRIIQHGGWHFSYMGGADMIREKILSGSDTWVVERKNDYGSVDNIEKCLKNIEDLYHRKEHDKQCKIVDSELPSYITANRERFNKFFYEKP